MVAQGYPSPVRIGQVAAGLVGHVLVVSGGVAIGSVAVGAIRRRGLVVLVSVSCCLLDIAILGAPPARLVLALFDRDHPARLASSLSVIGGETAVLVLILSGVSVAVARRRA